MVDLVIIILVLLGAFVGMRRGFTRELVSVIGFIICIVLAFIFKNPVASFLYDHLPFFSFGGVLRGVTALNILLYEVIAFLITLSIFGIVLKIVTMLTNVFEKFLSATIILGIPSKILGAVLGAVEWLIICFVILFVLALPVFNNKFVYKSVIYDKMLPVATKFSKQATNTLTLFNEIQALKEGYTNSMDTNQFNLDSLDLLLKYHVIDVESAKKLYNKGKFKTINNIESVLSKYEVVE